MSFGAVGGRAGSGEPMKRIKRAWVADSEHRGYQIERKEPPTSRYRNWRCQAPGRPGRWAEHYTRDGCVRFLDRMLKK